MSLKATARVGGSGAARAAALAVAVLAIAGACATRGDVDALMVEHQRVLERQN